jgi:hypothetical protein
MTRLNQSRRQLVGYVYNSQVDNDVSQTPNIKSLNSVLEQSFDRNMTGGGMKRKMKPKKVDTTHIQFDKGVGGNAINEPVITGEGMNTKKIIKRIPHMGEGLQLAGTGLSIAGTGLSVAGAGKHGMLPGEMLRKKILKKVIKEKLMKKMTGGLLNIPRTSSGRSMDKTLEGMRGYVLDGNGKGKYKNKKGGFFPFIIAAIAAAASTASAVAATTIVGSVTVGSLAGAALTGAATAAGAVAIKKIAGSGKGKKGGALLETLKPIFLKAAEKATFTIDDFSKQAQDKIVAVGNIVKDNPTVQNIKQLGEVIAPYAQQIIKEKITEKVAPTLQKVGLSVGGKFMSGKGAEADKFNNNFVKAFPMELKSSI